MVIVYPNSFCLPVIKFEEDNYELKYRESSFREELYQSLNCDIFREIDEEYVRSFAKE